MLRYYVDPPGGGRVLVTDTITILEPGDAGAVVVSGSHGGVSSAQFVMGHSIRAVFYNDAGIGKDRAGVKALDILAQYECPAIAVDYRSARIGSGVDTWDHGVVSEVNAWARRAGAVPGLSVPDATSRLAHVPVAQTPLALPVLSRNDVMIDGIAIVLIDSISMLNAGDTGRIVVSGSHGGAVSGEFARRHRPRLAVFNDAGVGRDEAGLAAVVLLDEAGVAAVTIDRNTGRIGDPSDMLESGVVSFANAAAAALGVHDGPLREQLARLTR